ncbi:MULTISPECIES: hypothetical protein [Bradyrhizobium]|jgi:photoprotection regulator FRP-like protein|uniref:hypothetical protein n=1 Tax=Bradyrhizobium TaxID=374 RepID=UPI000481C733|nr:MULTISPECIES: hypothetical protein [Bradyrhizobium]MCS3448886.1 hypothetical protein [Bradyrhizobium elkanii]MCS3559971.1 hypothetical protein [Bradyrhizobium elkanii]MCW2150183.1 hypothetical protein [Bradyrhizobium elkanii]MCW2359759.1 hypothetical protein [Bradyrhizobium elkanii]MCW2373914.1 hypothetical protein [Bradyrhizobium elkanii]
MYRDLQWSPAEKKIARKAYDSAVECALAKVMVEFKSRAVAAATPSEMWEVGAYLHQQRGELDEMFDYRYSQLPLVFARLIREQHLDEALLAGLSDEKRQVIRSILSLVGR